MTLWISAGAAIGILGSVALGFVDSVLLGRRVYWSTWLLSLGVMTLGLRIAVGEPRL